MQKLGQHFLNNDLVLQKIISALELEEGSTVIEIGPGRGALTIPLAAACEATRCRLVAIEKDAALASALVAEFAATTSTAEAAITAATTDVEIITGDALKLLPTAVITATKSNENYLIVGNIPYYITGKLLRVISETETKPRQCVLMVQREVAERICATPPAMNRLSASVQFWAQAKIIAAVPKKDFTPPPNVDSAVILLTKKPVAPAIDANHYYQTVRAVFAQPRKTILNNVSAIKKDAPKDELAALLKKLDIRPDDRPQDLSVAKIIALAGALWG